MKKMKYNIALLISLCGICMACTQEELVNEAGKDTLAISLNLPEVNVDTYAVAAEAGESKIGNVYLLFYAQGAATNVPPVAFYSETGLANNGSWSKELGISAMGLTKNVTYDVFALANLPASTAAPTATTTQNQLLAITETQFVRTLADPQIALYGKANCSGGGDLAISLKRIVAKINLQVLTPDLPADWTVTKVEMTNERKTTLCVGEQTLGAAVRVTGEMLPTGTAGEYRYYVYENEQGNDASSLKICATLTDAYGQQEQVFGVLNKGEGGKILRNCIYTATMTINHPQETAVDVEMNAISWDDQKYEERDASLRDPESNCYILKPGEVANIPVSQANRDSSIVNNGDVLTCTMVWSQVKGLANDGVVKNISVMGTGPNAILQVMAGTSPGNAVVAIKKNDGTIAWSWHIWVINYDPITTAVTANGLTVMGCHLGAIYNESAKHDQSYGLFYEWGRKDPFPFILSNPVSTAIFSENGSTKSISKATVVGSIKESIQNPDMEYYLSGNMWEPVNDINLWGATGPKAAYDPCPFGWRVPTMAEYLKIGQGRTSAGNGYNTAFGYFPKTGILQPKLSVDGSCYHHFCDGPTSPNGGTRLVGDISNPNTYGGRNQLTTIRCVADKGSRPY